ncbi:hypothetical protein, partial [Paenibacillus dendritiformis]|uniref:hypothetical protein n=1 Tax=Paenibacillus dendritiformis TaxID=130049 RepID=UPI001BCC912F
PESPVPILIFNVQAGNFEGILCFYKGLEKDSKLPSGNTIRGGLMLLFFIHSLSTIHPHIINIAVAGDRFNFYCWIEISCILAL